MSSEEQKNTVCAFADYLDKNGLKCFLLVYAPEGDLTCSAHTDENFPAALSVALGDMEGLDEALANALFIHANNKGQIRRFTNEN